MNMGEYIRLLRTERKWSQEELGRMLNPPVNRAAVNKWETGIVQNLKRTHIQQLARIFNVTPTELMCFDSKCNESQIAMETKVIEAVQGAFGKDAVLILQYFMELNDDGKQQALKNVSDLAEVPKYQVQFKAE